MIRALRNLLSLPSALRRRRRKKVAATWKADHPKTREGKAAKASAKVDKGRKVRAVPRQSRGHVARILEKIDAGRAHASLGPQLKEGSAERAKITFDRLIERGVQPSHYVVDLGCGTLRIGALLIDFLDPERYVGLDLDQRLLELGRGMLPAELVERKRPALWVVAPDSLAAVAALEPHWIFAKGVLQHVSLDELGSFFGNIAVMAGDRTTIVIQASKLEDTTRRLSSRSWAHSLADLEAQARKAGLSVREMPNPLHRGAKSLILGKA